MSDRYAARAQTRMVDALSWEWQTRVELARQVWPNRPVSRSVDMVTAVIRMLRKRGIAIETLPGHGYKFAEVRLRSSADVLE